MVCVHDMGTDGPGLTVQSHHRHQANEPIFRRLGFEPAPEPKLDRKGRAAAKAKGKAKAKAKNNTWHQSGLHSLLLFDRVRKLSDCRSSARRSVRVRSISVVERSG